MKRSISFCLLAVIPALLTISPPAMACRSQRDACYKNCNRLNSKIERFFCYLGDNQGGVIRRPHN